MRYLKHNYTMSSTGRMIYPGSHKPIYPQFIKWENDNGYLFLANYHTMEEAELVANFYISHGIDAVIEHDAPWQEGVKFYHGVELHTVFLEDLPDLAERKAAIPEEDNQAFLESWRRLYSQKEDEYILKHRTHRLPI